MERGDPISFPESVRNGGYPECTGGVCRPCDGYCRCGDDVDRTGKGSCGGEDWGEGMIEDGHIISGLISKIHAAPLYSLVCGVLAIVILLVLERLSTGLWVWECGP